MDGLEWEILIRRPLAKGGARLGVWLRSDRRFPKAICRDDVGATSDLAVSAREICFLWIPKVTWNSFSVCVLLGMGSNPAAVRVFRNRPPKDLQFFGVRFAWHGLESCCCSGVSEPASKGLAPMVSELRPQLGCRKKALVFMGSKGNGKHFGGPGFAWHGLSILSDLRLQGTCANGFGTSLAPRVPDKRTVFCVSEPGLAPMVSEPAAHRGCRTKELFFMGSKGDGKHFVGLRFAWHGLESCCCSSVSEPASKGLAPMVSEPAAHRGCRTKELFFMGSKGNGKHFVGLRFAWHGLESCCCSSVSEPASKGLAPQWFRNQPRTEGARQKNCFLWVPKVTGSILSGCVLLGISSNPAAVRVFRNRPPRDLRQWFRNQPRTEGARQENCFLWVPKVTGSILLGCVLLGMGSNPAAVRVFRNRPPRDLRQWFRNQPRTEGARQKNCFLWVPKVTGSILSGCVLLGIESCCCSSVSEPASKGLAPMVSEPASHRGCQTKELFFMGSKGDGKHFVGLRFTWHGLESCCCSSVSEPASKGLAPMVSEPASHRGCQTKELFFMGSKGDGKHFVGLRFLLGMGSNPAAVRVFRNRPPRDLRQWFRNQPRTEGARQKNCFLWVPKVTGSILSGCVLLGMGSNPAAVRVFRNRPPRDLRQWFRNQPRTEGARQKNCFLWVPKVTGSILSGCVLLGMGSNPAAVRVFRNRPPRDLRQWFRNQPRTEGARQKNCFLWVPKWREAFCRAAFYLAWARILLLFECFGTGLQGTCANGFGTSLAPRVPDKRTVFYGFQRWREAFCRAAFCLAWARILLLFECFGTGLQGTCANGFGTSLAPRVPDKRTVFYGFQRWREAFCRAAFCLAWARILLLFECFGTGLQGTCANGFGTSLAPRVPDKRTVFYGFQRWREAVFRYAFCLAWARILLLFECFGTGPSKDLRFGMGSNPAAVRVLRNRPPKDLRQSDRRFPMQGHLPRWCRSDEWSGYIGQRDLFFMDSKGDVKQFFFVWCAFCMTWARNLLLVEGFGRGVVQWFWVPESHLLLRFVATVSDLEGFGRGVVQWPCIFFNGLALFRGVPPEAALYLL